jgi:hypothetical protein
MLWRHCRSGISNKPQDKVREAVMALIGSLFANIATGGDDFHHVTVDIDFAPANSFVTTSISRFGTPGGVVQAGILNYRVRTPENRDAETSFADLSNLDNTGFDDLPAAVAHNNMTHVTMLVMTLDAWTRGLLVVLNTDYPENSDD